MSVELQQALFNRVNKNISVRIVLLNDKKIVPFII